MTGIRNGVLARSILSSTGWEPLLTVPFNFTVLLKTVHVFNESAAAVTVYVRAFSSTGPETAYLPPFELEPNGIAVWEGWTCLNQGDQLQAVAVPGVHIWVAGACLPGAAPPLDRGELVVPLS